ncbi:DNA-binding MarR family transcriptional regulator [Kitasatospora sp. MAP12-15]|uniref:MarR family winged helix-turn-helix transcriptional regulator n=1 Tax=unclassified Kitasatospora TaxID=2633591 RepID=UPI002476D769|nr:MarR family transcriptional regulator [Kitasatospora sp. MAP12-44]MDH6114768.1 DNA-binding MarR family transcriptional regulator [Kitasatospora sp. MAP12-44]
MEAQQNQVGHEVADALGALFKRSVRTTLYQELTRELGEAVDEVSYPVLSGLARTGPRSAAELAAEVGLDRSGVSRRASRLEAAGLVRREPDPDDGRSVLLTLTERGEQTVEVMRERLAARISASLSSWPPDEARAFARALRRFTEDGPFGEHT